jgi:hypothetical protein
VAKLLTIRLRKSGCGASTGQRSFLREHVRMLSTAPVLGWKQRMGGSPRWRKKPVFLVEGSSSCFTISRSGAHC